MPRLKTRITAKLVSGMSPDEVAQCTRLKLRSGSRIVSDLIHHRFNTKTRARVVLLRDQRDRILSWGLIDYTDGPKPVVQLYTHYRYRRRGFGTKVVDKIKRVVDGVRCTYFKHDDRSKAFFEKTMDCAPQ